MLDELGKEEDIQMPCLSPSSMFKIQVSLRLQTIIAVLQHKIQSMDFQLHPQDVKAILSNLPSLEHISRSLLEEICLIFKIDTVRLSAPNMLKQLKASLADLFLQKGDKFRQELQKQKGKKIGKNAKKMLLRVAEEAWKEIVHHRGKQKYRNLKRRLDQLTPKFTQTSESARFHLRLLSMYQQAPFCPANRWAPEYMPTGYPPMPFPNYPPMYYPPGGPQPPVPTPPLPGKTDSNERPPFMMNGMRMPPHPMMNFNGYPRPPHMMPPHNMPNSPVQGFNGHQHAAFKRDTISNGAIQEETGKVDFRKSLDRSLDLFEHYRFIQCECQGKINDGREAFFCRSCDFGYHYDCIKIKEGDSDELCPLCVLRRPTLMSEMLGYPLMTAWHKSHRDFHLKIQKQHSDSIRKAKAEGLACLLRFLKVNRLNRGNEKGFGISSEVIIPEIEEDMVEPMVLEISLNKDRMEGVVPNEAVEEEPLYLFALMVSKARSFQQVKESFLASAMKSGEEFYKQHWPQHKERVMIGTSYSNGSRLTQIPVRGNHCTHLEIFDLEDYLLRRDDSKSGEQAHIPCPVCHKPCPELVLDQYLFEAIRAHPSYDESRPIGLWVQRSGENNWEYAMPEASSPEEMVEESEE